MLDTAQKLYERKLTSYPRSDCEFLPESQQEDTGVIIANLSNLAQNELAGWAAKADTAIVSRAWNDKKITAHHAIIPTVVRCNFAGLSETERNIYFLIAQAYIAQFYPVHVYDQTRAELKYAAEAFIANGRIVKELGWKEIYSADTEEKRRRQLNAASYG